MYMYMYMYMQCMLGRAAALHCIIIESTGPATSL